MPSTSLRKCKPRSPSSNPYHICHEHLERVCPDKEATYWLRSRNRPLPTASRRFGLAVNNPQPETRCIQQRNHQQDFSWPRPPLDFLCRLRNLHELARARGQTSGPRIALERIRSRQSLVAQESSPAAKSSANAADKGSRRCTLFLPSSSRSLMSECSLTEAESLALKALTQTLALLLRGGGNACAVRRRWLCFTLPHRRSASTHHLNVFLLCGRAF